jgi:hypothetical protein
MCNIWSVLFNETVVVFVLRSIARRQIVKMKNPCAHATMYCKVRKSVIALYCLCVSIIRNECVTKC